MTSTGDFDHILVPIEFENSETDGAAPQENGGDSEAENVGPWTVRALETAARLARTGQLWLVHVHHDFSDYATWMPPSRMDELNAAAAQHATEALERVAERYCPDMEVHCIIESGNPLDVILRVADQHPPDAIVLAASSRGRVSRAFHGSTVDKVIRRARCPVVVIPSGNR